MPKMLLALLLAAACAAPTFAQDAGSAQPLEEGCVNEIGILCRGLHGGRLLSCLDENRDSALPQCRASLDAEHSRLDKERDEREAARQEEKLRAELGEEQDARLVGASGGVFVHTAAMPEGQYAKAEPGTPLSAGDIIRVAADGSADVALEGGSLISLTPNTDFTVNSLSPEESEFHLGLGRLIAKLAKLLPGRQMRFVTPTAVAAVRGTELVVEQPGDKPSVIGVLDEGHVAVSSLAGGGEVTLGPNQETQVARAGAPQAPKPLAELQSAKAAIAGVRQRATAAQKQWKPLLPAQRIAQRLQVARRPLLPAAKLPGVAPAQQKRDYPEARQRQSEIRRRRAQGGAAPEAPVQRAAPGGGGPAPRPSAQPPRRAEPAPQQAQPSKGQQAPGGPHRR